MPGSRRSIAGARRKRPRRNQKKSGPKPALSRSERDPKTLAIIAAAVMVFAPGVVILGVVAVVEAFLVVMCGAIVVAIVADAERCRIVVLRAFVPAIAVAVADGACTGRRRRDRNRAGANQRRDGGRGQQFANVHDEDVSKVHITHPLCSERAVALPVPGTPDDSGRLMRVGTLFSIPERSK